MRKRSSVASCSKSISHIKEKFLFKSGSNLHAKAVRPQTTDGNNAENSNMYSLVLETC